MVKVCPKFVAFNFINDSSTSDLEILLFPCNQFMGMPSTELSEIATFVNREKIDFAVTFAPVDIMGSDMHPLFAFLKAQRPGCIAWNYAKFIVSKNGREVVRFNHRVLYSAIENGIRNLI